MPNIDLSFSNNLIFDLIETRLPTIVFGLFSKMLADKPQILAETQICCWRSLVCLVIHLCNYNENFRLLHLTYINLRWMLIMFSLIVPPFTSICMMFLKHHNCLPV
ncbi:hypothetical protein Hanom_Chr09g00773051 [Helianthus anomalus]